MSPPRSLASSVTARAAIGRRIFPGFLAALVLAACADPALADEKQPPPAQARLCILAERLPLRYPWLPPAGSGGDGGFEFCLVRASRRLSGSSLKGSAVRSVSLRETVSRGDGRDGFEEFAVGFQRTFTGC
jgi:hypothetical protein